MKLLSLLGLLMLASFLGTAQTTPNGLAINTKAPGFSAVDQNGKAVSLDGLLKKGPVVIVFYRGQWCPYCNKQLSQLEDSVAMINAKGATLLAVSPEQPENINKTVSKTKATYPILFDDGLKIMNAYDVAFKVDDNTIERYKKFGIDFDKANGSNGANLPVPAVYIINKNGKIIFTHFNPDYKERVSVKEILSHL